MLDDKYTSSNQKKKIIVAKKIKTRDIGNYILEQTINKNSFSKSKIGKHKILEEKVQIKIINIKENSYISKIKQNLEIISHLHHKNILQLYEIIETTNKLYIITQYCELTLSKYIIDQKNLNESDICRLFQQIIDCFEYLYLSNIYCSCIRLENIYLDSNNRIKIDFLDTLNKDINDDIENDLYNIIKGIGLILYEMLGGKMNFQENDKNLKNILLPDNISTDAVDLVEKMIHNHHIENFVFSDIKSHPWFNLVKPKMRPGIIYDLHKIPIDENILDKIEKMGYDKKTCEKSILENKYDSLMAIYLLLLNKYINEGNESIADLFSDKYLSYINDKNNWIDIPKKENNLYEKERNSKNINNLYKSNKEKKLFSSLIRRRNEGNLNIMSESLNLNDFFSSKDLIIINNNISEILDSRHETIAFEQINSSKMFQTGFYNNDSNFESNYFLSPKEDKLSLKKSKFINTINTNKNISNKKFIKIKRKKKKDIDIKKPNIEEIINKRIFKNKEINSKQNNDKKLLSLNINDNKSNINSKGIDMESNLILHKNNNETEIRNIDKKNNFNFSYNVNTNFNNYISSTPKKIKILQKSKGINSNDYNKTERKKQSHLIKNNSSLTLEEPLEKNKKYKLEKKIKEELTNFDNDLNMLDNLFNLNGNKRGIDIQFFADKLIHITNVEDIYSNNNCLEKYKKGTTLISELYNENIKDKLSELNYLNIEQIFEDKDDYIISEKLLNNKYFSSFISKLKESRKENMNKRAKKTRQKLLNKSYFIERNNILNISKYNIDNEDKNTKCELNNIIMNQTQKNFYVKRPNISDNEKKIFKTSKLKNRFINTYSLLKTFSPNFNDIQNLYSN